MGSPARAGPARAPRPPAASRFALLALSARGRASPIVSALGASLLALAALPAHGRAVAQPRPETPAAVAPGAPTAVAAQPSPDTHLLTVAAITLPVGASLRYDWLRALGEPSHAGARAGLYASYLFYSVELGARVGWAAVPEWLELHLDLGAEPGFFRKLDPAAVPADPPGRGDVPRTFGARWVARAQANLNLRFGRVWLYGRTTALFRWRDFLEDDVFNRIRIRTEASLEQATAAMYRVFGDDRAAAVWAYAEYTVGGVLDVGVRPHRGSGGVVVERFPVDSVTVNVDLFYSGVRDFRGPGVIVVVWVRP